MIQRAWVAATVLVLIGGLAGCAAMASATSKYGKTETTLPYTVEQVGPVAEAVVTDFGLADVTATITKIDAVVTGANAEGKLVTVTVTPAGTRTAKVDVTNKAGKDVAEQILDEIEQRLENPGAAGSAGPPDATPWLLPGSASEDDGDAAVESSDDNPFAGDAVDESP